MGWKTLKEHYRISHIVHITPEGICIGSPYVPDLIVISLDGDIKKSKDDRYVNEDLQRYIAEMRSDPETLKKVVAASDSFSASIPVFTYDGGDVIEKKCEKLKWPNVTHDGCLMYENTFSTDKEQVIKWAKSNAMSGISVMKDNIASRRKELDEAVEYLRKYEADLQKLNALKP